MEFYVVAGKDHRLPQPSVKFLQLKEINVLISKIVSMA